MLSFLERSRGPKWSVMPVFIYSKPITGYEKSNKRPGRLLKEIRNCMHVLYV